MSGSRVQKEGKRGEAGGLGVEAGPGVGLHAQHTQVTGGAAHGRSQGVPRTAESERLTALFSQVREGRHLPALLAAGAPRRPLPVQRLPLPAPLPRRVPAVQGGGVQGLRLLLPLLQRLRGEGQEGRGLLPAEGGRRRGAHPAAGPTRRQEELG